MKKIGLITSLLLAATLLSGGCGKPSTSTTDTGTGDTPVYSTLAPIPYIALMTLSVVTDTAGPTAASPGPMVTLTLKNISHDPAEPIVSLNAAIGTANFNFAVSSASPLPQGTTASCTARLNGEYSAGTYYSLSISGSTQSGHSFSYNMPVTVPFPASSIVVTVTTTTGNTATSPAPPTQPTGLVTTTTTAPPPTEKPVQIVVNWMKRLPDSAAEPLDTGGPLYELNLENVSTGEPITALSAVFDNVRFDFDVTTAKPLQPGTSSISTAVLTGTYKAGVSYNIHIEGTTVSGTKFSYDLKLTVEFPTETPAPTTSTAPPAT